MARGELRPMPSTLHSSSNPYETERIFTNVGTDNTIVAVNRDIKDQN